MPRPILLAALAAGVLAATAPATGQAQQRGDGVRRVDTTFTFARTGSVSITLTAGNVTITGTSGDRIRVRATSEADDVRFDATSTRVTLERSGSRSYGEEARFELSVPHGVRVSVRTRTGDVSIRGTRGEVEASTQSGDIRIMEAERVEVSTLSGDVEVDGATGPVDLRAVSGDLRLRAIRGDVEATSVSGDVDLREVTARYVRVKSTSGDVSFAGNVDPAGRYELTTHSGEVDLTVPQNTGAQLSVSTWNGTVESDFPITLRPGEHGIGAGRAKRFTFQIGNGAARIDLESFSGDINIFSAANRQR